MNIEKNFTKDGHPITYKTLDTSIERLRNKYKALKQEWSKIITRMKSGSGLSLEKEPVWFKHLDPVFCETNEEMKLTSSATETSFLNEQDGEYEEERNGEKKDILSGADEMDENNELESEIEASNELNIGNATSGDKRKVVVAPHRKSKQVRSNKQALSEIANGLEALAETSQKNNKMMIGEERKREERHLSCPREEVEKNKQHEFLISQIFANTSQPQFPYRFQPGHQGNSSTSSTSDPYQPVQDDIIYNNKLFIYFKLTKLQKFYMHRKFT